MMMVMMIPALATATTTSLATFLDTHGHYSSTQHVQVLVTISVMVHVPLLIFYSSA